jgi:hypothetical protein
MKDFYAGSPAIKPLSAASTVSFFYPKPFGNIPKPFGSVPKPFKDETIPYRDKTMNDRRTGLFFARHTVVAFSP